MTIELENRADAWLAQARIELDGTALGPRAEQVGRVEEVGDGIAIVSGLPNVRLDELLRFDKGQFGFVQVLERERVGCVLLDDVDAIEAGDMVRGTGDVVRVPAGPAMLGRVVDPLGRPLDGIDVVILDPVLTTGLPTHLTAATGIDALVHAIEAATNANANPANNTNQKNKPIIPNGRVVPLGRARSPRPGGNARPRQPIGAR